MDISEVKKNLNKMVVYKGISDVYKLRACIIRKGKKGYFYEAELLDIKHGNSLIICGLNDIEKECTNDD